MIADVVNSTGRVDVVGDEHLILVEGTVGSVVVEKVFRKGVQDRYFKRKIAIARFVINVLCLYAS